VKKEKLTTISSVFHARKPELFNLTEELASLHSCQRAPAVPPGPFSSACGSFGVSPSQLSWLEKFICRKKSYLSVRDALCQPLAQGAELGNC